MPTYSQVEEELYSKWCSEFDLARYRLLAIVRQEGTQEVKRLGIAIDKEISQNTYLKFCESERDIIVKYCLIDGKIEAYDMPDESHAYVQGELSFIMRSWSNQLAVTGERDLIVNSRSVYRGDINVRPKHIQPQQPQRPQPPRAGQHCPNLVVEIGNTEGLGHLHRKVVGYFSSQTTTQLYLAIKLFPPRPNNTFALLALLYSRNNPNPTIPVIVKSFGTASLSIPTRNYLQNTINVPVNIITGVGIGPVPIPCDRVNIPEYQLAIPTNPLFNGARGGVPIGTPQYFYIDLFVLQDVYQNSL
ncbi:1_t:CDS:1 [Diversispora eburnea]|uniref:1_t:CDS:1 n=1 Tax=Diversispora eburnea TaxID=1213867 RepID=A0A9N9GBR2_9GLOM|nr:1_t:CDS:1 [Diversispora eburnea]